MKRLSQEEFINKSLSVHGDKYGYNKTVYIRSKSEIIITCPKHGDFKQLPNNHLMGHGCPKCRSLRIPKKEILNRFNEKHKNKYNYSKFKYKGIDKKSIIICPNHGEFKQTPSVHSRCGCPKCDKSYKKNNSDFIESAKLKHNNFYSYSKTIYQKSNEKIIIICPKHGEFKQIANDHLRGSGCQECSGVKNLNKKELIQKFNIKHNNVYKYDLTDYTNVNSIIKIKCDTHGWFDMKVKYHNTGSGCPNCINYSKGEEKIFDILTKNNINFEQNKRFKECRNKHPLPFDFHIKEKDILIEYDGIQHFEKRFNMTEKQFKLRQKLDKIKDKYCKDNNIYLVRIPYTEFNNIEEILIKNKVII